MTATERPDPFSPCPPNKRAEHLAEQALSDIRSGKDAIQNLDAAIAALRIEAGELSPDELDGYACECSDDDCPFAVLAAEAAAYRENEERSARG